MYAAGTSGLAVAVLNVWSAAIVAKHVAAAAQEVNAAASPRHHVAAVGCRTALPVLLLCQAQKCSVLHGAQLQRQRLELCTCQALRQHAATQPSQQLKTAANATHT